MARNTHLSIHLIALAITGGYIVYVYVVYISRIYCIYRILYTMLLCYTDGGCTRTPGGRPPLLSGTAPGGCRREPGAPAAPPAAAARPAFFIFIN